jgi:hypothetical protein
MNAPRARLRTRRVRFGVLAMVFAVVAAMVIRTQLPAGAVTVPAPGTTVTGNSTYFDGLGAPYGGCGLPQAELDTQDFVALNVYDTPRDYAFYPRPLTGADLAKKGMWDNGHNCGRWVQVKISDYCTGVNDGAPNQAFCRNGSWVSDAYNGGVLNMIVADSCGDSNSWCRDDPYHLDLSKGSLNKFAKNGVISTDMYPNHFNNRHLDWSFIPAPSYTGDISIGFMSGAQQWWPAIAVSHLANGIHSVEYLANGVWTTAAMNSDMGQSYIIGGTASGGTQFQIRVRDVEDKLINNGRVYSFALPSSCSPCGAAYTKVSYTTGGGSTDPSPSVSPVSPSPSRSSASPSPSQSSASPLPSVTSASPKPSQSSVSPGGCRATWKVDSSWPGGAQATVTVANAGATSSKGWAVSFTLPGVEKVTGSWNATVSQSGQRVTASNVTYNGAVAAGSSVSWGLLVDGATAPTDVACTLS